MAEAKNHEIETVSPSLELEASLQQNKAATKDQKLQEQEQVFQQLLKQVENQQKQSPRPATPGHNAPRPAAPAPASNLTNKNTQPTNKKNQVQPRPGISAKERLQNSKTIVQETSRLLVNQMQNNAGRVPKWQKNPVALNQRVMDIIMNSPDKNLKSLRLALLRNAGGNQSAYLARFNIESTLRRLMPTVSREVLLAYKNQLIKINQDPTAQDATRNQLQTTGAENNPMFRRQVASLAAANLAADNNLMYFLDKSEEIKEDQAKEAYDLAEDNTNQANLNEQQQQAEAIEEAELIEESTLENSSISTNNITMEPQQSSQQIIEQESHHQDNRSDEKHESMLHEVFGEAAKESFVHKALEALQSSASNLPNLSL